jgi:hypothetical protein
MEMDLFGRYLGSLVDRDKKIPVEIRGFSRAAHSKPVALKDVLALKGMNGFWLQVVIVKNCGVNFVQPFVTL